MCTPAGDSRPALSKRLHPPEWAALSVGTLFLAWIVLKPFSPFVFKSVANLFECFGPFLAAGWCLSILRREAQARRRLAVACLGLGVLSFAAGQSLWSWYEIVLRHDCPFPSWSDAGYLSAYPFLLAGILLMPRRRLPPALRGRVLLDSLMALAGLFFQLVFHPRADALAGRRDAARKSDRACLPTL